METKNILRQNFIHEDVGRNKAEVLTERYSGLYSNVTLSHIPKYATWEKYDRLKNIKRTAQEMEQYIDLDAINLEENSSIISLVDNEAFKIKLDIWSMPRNSVLFNSGININNGQVFADSSYYIPRYILNHIELIHDREELDLNPSCADVATTSEPDQRYVGNDLAATMLASKVQEHFERNFFQNTFHRFESFTLRPKVSVTASSAYNPRL